jgi:TPR repeat protein
MNYIHLIEKKYKIDNIHDMDEDKIIKLFRDCIIDSHYDDDRYYNFIGLFYLYRIYDIKNAVEYFIMAIDKKNDNAKYNLEILYEDNYIAINLDRKYDEMAISRGITNAMLKVADNYWNNNCSPEKHYLMAMEKGNIRALHKLGKMYINYGAKELGKKYYLQGVEKGCSDSMYCLGNYYETHEKNDDLMKKYYSMACEKDNIHSMYKLIQYYSTIKNNYMISKYCLMVIKKMTNESSYGYNDKIMNNISKFYGFFFKHNEAIRYYLFARHKKYYIKTADIDDLAHIILCD